MPKSCNASQRKTIEQKLQRIPFSEFDNLGQSVRERPIETSPLSRSGRRSHFDLGSAVDGPYGACLAVIERPSNEVPAHKEHTAQIILQIVQKAQSRPASLLFFVVTVLVALVVSTSLPVAKDNSGSINDRA